MTFHHLSVSELDGLIFCLQDFSSYLDGRDFTIYTDNSALLMAFRACNSNTFILRRLDLLLIYFPMVQFITGTENHLADSSSRFPIVLLG